MSLLEQVTKYTPTVCFHPREDSFPCSIEYALSGSTLKNNKDSTFAIVGPTQDDLYAHRTEDYYIEVNSSQFGGMTNNQAPVYFAVQNGPNETIIISYIFLFAFQSGQTIHVDRVIGSYVGDIDIIINNYGMHQGDIERVTVVLKASNFSLVEVNYEAHGDTTNYSPDKVYFEQDTHPVVNLALGGHSSRNSFQEGLRVKDDDAKIFDVISLMGDLTSGGTIWRPQKLIQLGLDAHGEPINDQKWAVFAGRIGAHQVNELNSATTIDGDGLNFLQWAYVKTLGGVLDSLRPFYQLEFVQGNGPEGPGKRPWVTNAVPAL